MLKLCFENGKSPNLVKKDLEKKYLDANICQRNMFFVLLLNLSRTKPSVTEEKILLIYRELGKRLKILKKGEDNYLGYLNEISRECI